jgi:hypothetical protein
VEGNRYRYLKGKTDNTVTDNMLQFLASSLTRTGIGSKNSVTTVTECDKLIPDGGRDHALFHFANVLAKHRVPEEEIRQMIGLIGFHACEQGKDPIDQATIDIKIASAMKRAGRDRGSMAQQVRDWVNETEGDFSVTLLDKELDIVTSSDKANRRQIMKRLVEGSIIERDKKRAGWFRVPDDDEEIIDFSNIEVVRSDVRLPFDITEKLVYLMPKSIVLIAGSPNVGKTAFMLNVVKLNAGRELPIKFFSSEMGKEDLLDRINLFKSFPKLSKMKFVERSSNFHDVIEPDSLNVIDFLEISNNFYEVGGLMTKIRDKLKSGMAVIAIQKNKNKDEAVGGHFAMEKPRLVVTLDREDFGVAGMRNVARITKAKGRLDMRVNPVGQELIYSLYRGCEFKVESDWNGGDSYDAVTEETEPEEKGQQSLY